MRHVGASGAHVAVGARLADRYLVRRVLRTGESWAAFEGEGPHGDTVDVEVVDAHAGPEAHALLFADVQRAAATESPFCAAIIEHGTDAASGMAFVVAARPPGETLLEVITRLRPVDPLAVTALGVQIARGLSAHHAAGVVHGDVRPAQIIVAHDGEGGVRAVLRASHAARALGIAAWRAHAPAGGEGGGTEGADDAVYAAPEQAMELASPTPATDVYALAATLTHALTGAAPTLRRETETATAALVAAGDVESIQLLAPWIDPRLARVLHGARLADSALRCPTPETLAAALLPLLAPGSDPRRLARELLQTVPAAVRARVGVPFDIPRAWDIGRNVEVKASPPEETARLGEILGGKYRIVRALGRGGMGEVFEATTSAGVHVAVKVLRARAGRADENADSNDARDDEQARRRFEREGRAVRSIESPHVVRVLDVGYTAPANAPYLAMELLTGADLASIVRRGGPLEPRAAARLAVQACRGLTAAHARGVVHRDVKPSNLFVHEPPGEPARLKVCDFGIAKTDAAALDGTLSTELTHTGGILGSPAYMSPEQLRNAKSVDHRADLWGLAVALYEALAGERPFRGASGGAELILAICNEDAPRLATAERAPWLEPELAAVVHRALARDIDARFPTADALAAALEPFAAPAASLTLATLGHAPHAGRFLADRARDATPNPGSGGSSVPRATALSPRGLRAPPPKPAARRLIAAAIVVTVGAGIAAAGVLRPARREAASSASSLGPPAAADVAASASAPSLASPPLPVPFSPPPAPSALAPSTGKRPHTPRTPSRAPAASASASASAPRPSTPPMDRPDIAKEW